MDKDKLNQLIDKMQKKSGGVKTSPLEEEQVEQPKQLQKSNITRESIAKPIEKEIITPEIEEEDVEEYDSDLDDDSDLDSDIEIQKKIHLLQDKQKEINKKKEIAKEKPIEKEEEKGEEIKINPLVDNGIFRTEILLALNFHNKQLFRIANLLENVFGNEKTQS